MALAGRSALVGVRDRVRTRNASCTPRLVHVSADGVLAAQLLTCNRAICPFLPFARFAALHESGLFTGISRWRDPDSNRGHHDFQSCGVVSESAGLQGFRRALRVWARRRFGVLCGRFRCDKAHGRVRGPFRRARATCCSARRRGGDCSIGAEAPDWHWGHHDVSRAVADLEPWQNFCTQALYRYRGCYDEKRKIPSISCPVP